MSNEWRWERDSVGCMGHDVPRGNIVCGEDDSSTHRVVAQMVDKSDADLILRAFKDQKDLGALRAAGVDNWEGYCQSA
jgi:hypothetical protein